LPYINKNAVCNELNRNAKKSKENTLFKQNTTRFGVFLTGFREIC